MYDGITIILIILIIGIVLDGIRRMRNARRDSLKISRNAKKADRDLSESNSNSEFPSGGARVVAYRDAEIAQNFTKSVRQKYSSTRVTVGAPNRIPEQVALNLEESVPMLMESVQEQSRREQDAQSNDQSAHDPKNVGDEVDGTHLVDHDVDPESEETDINESEFIDDDDSYDHDSVKRTLSDYNANDMDDDANANNASSGRDPVIGDLSSLDDVNETDDAYASSITDMDDFDTPVAYQPVGEKPNAVKDSKERSIKSGFSRLKEAARSADLFSSGEQHKTHDTAYVNESSKPNKVKVSNKVEPERRDPDEVIVFNLMAKPGYVFDGQALLDALMDEGMKLGDMDIFHRHYEDDGDGPVLFSLANMVVPGTFNLSKMAEFTTPGVSMFLSLPIATESIAAYDILVATATNLATRLDGDLKDENRSVLTKQTIEHARQRVVEYERKRKLARS